MNIGDLVTWRIDTIYDKSVPLEYGVVIGHFKGKGYRRNECVWVKFANGQHSHRERTLCAVQQLVVVEGTK